MFDRLSASARDAVQASVEEAHLRSDRRVGTDHLLLGLLHDAQVAGLLCITLEQARAGSRDLDRRALHSIGIDIGDFSPTATPRKRKRMQLTSGITSEARAIFPRAYTLADSEQVRKVTPVHLLCALLEREQPDPAAALLTELQIDRTDARAKATNSSTNPPAPQRRQSPEQST